MNFKNLMKSKKFLILSAFTVFILTFIIVFSLLLMNGRLIAPGTVSSLSTSNIDENSITLNWSNAKRALGYKIYRSDPDDGTFSMIAKTSSNSYKDTSLFFGTSYTYYVKPYNFVGDSWASQKLKITTKDHTFAFFPKNVLGYTVAESSSSNSLKSNSSLISELVTDTYSIDLNGNIKGTAPKNQIAFAKSSKIKALAMVSCSSKSTAKSFLDDSSKRQNLINNISDEISKNNYDGVNIDIENVYPSDRNNFSSFMKELYQNLHSKNLIVTCSLPAKDSENLNDDWSGAYDYSAIGKYCDKVMIMAYDEHYSTSKEGPVASIKWVTGIIKYTMRKIPRNKIYIGIAAYGYDWPEHGNAKSYSLSGIQKIADKYKSNINFDSSSKSPYFTYQDANNETHTVWFENKDSISAKFDAVNKYGVAGIGIWRLGLENSDYFKIIKSKLK